MNERILVWLLGLLSCGLLSSSNGQQWMLPPPTWQLTPPAGINLMTDYISLDRRQQLWLPTNQGLVRIKGQNLRVFHADWQPKEDAYGRPIPTPDGRIWVEQQTEGGTSQLAFIDSDQQRLNRVADTTRLVREFLSRYPFRLLYSDRQGQLWIALQKQGLLRVNPQSLTVEHIVSDPIQVEDMVEAPNGRIWFISTTNLYSLDPINRQTQLYQRAAGLPTTNRFQAIHVRDNGELLLSFFNEIGLLAPSTGQFRRILLPRPMLQENLWTGTLESDGVGNHYFSVGTMVLRLTKEGELQRLEFAHPTEKIISIGVSPGQGKRPPRLWVNTIRRALYEYDLSRLRPIPPFNILDVSINGTRLLENEHHLDERFVRDTTGQPMLRVQEQDFIRIRFAPSAELRSTLYRFKLDGYDRQWTAYRDMAGQATYQLPAGEYTFLFNQAKAHGGWYPQVARLLIRVKPLFWKTNWFLISTTIVLLGVLIGLFRIRQRRRNLQRALAQQENEARNLKQLDELKGRFFANITHELRTPLTLLLNANEQLAQQALDEQGKQQVNEINRHADHLLKLITQVLDMARLDDGKLDLKLSLGNPVEFTQQVIQPFIGLALTKRIQLTVQADLPDTTYYFDPQKLEAILHNLLSNAIKFTPDTGTIRVSARLDDAHQLVLMVQDSGPGIPPAEQTRIFERFYQVDAPATRTQSGTGIGLAYVRELAELMGGNVSVTSLPSQGSTFTVRLPLASVLPSTEVLSQVHTTPLTMETEPPSQSPTPSATPQRPVLLVVEDNAELRSYLVSQLSTHYEVLVAGDGRVGLQQALQHIPDLIVSDVMMPHMDGFALIGALKADLRTSHIPIILLTARSSHDSLLQGLEMGADVYLSKPFRLAQLKLYIRNAIQNRRAWQAILLDSAKRSPTETLRTDPVPEKEQRFLARLTHLLLQHIQDEQVDVDWLAAQAAMSRSQLHRKLAALTGQTTTAFIHSVRLAKADELLRAGGSNVAEVAQLVGYNSQSYFTKLFHERFGYLPTQLKE
ncbi:response regulator [Spirosoma sp. BT702]|uniref:histidine kinase n=1 Tax=Spirosoma profusum TaxID=2771354 RepID=A0A927AVL1_9BACT|nr:ATP-binding protein [Spirosoma profusum]MBD2705245.1 response regulator [Spirosoma profusum]